MKDENEQIKIVLVDTKTFLSGADAFKTIPEGSPPTFDVKVAEQLGLDPDLEKLAWNEEPEWTVDGILFLAFTNRYGNKEYLISKDWNFLSYQIDDWLKGELKDKEMYLFQLQSEKELMEFLNQTDLFGE